MGNIYVEQRKYPQAIKMYRMALDQIQDSHKGVRWVSTISSLQSFSALPNLPSLSPSSHPFTLFLPHLTSSPPLSAPTFHLVLHFIFSSLLPLSSSPCHWHTVCFSPLFQTEDSAEYWHRVCQDGPICWRHHLIWAHHGGKAWLQSRSEHKSQILLWNVLWLPVFRCSSASVYYTECRPKNKNGEGLGTRLAVVCIRNEASCCMHT